MREFHTICIGAGPAGLSAAYQLSKYGYSVQVLEQDPVYVGGISRTVKYNGYHFDIGGHRFFSKSKEVEDFWTEILAKDLLQRPRSSRIFYRGKFFSYPLKAFDALSKLGVFESIRCVGSYFLVQIKKKKSATNFEDWITQRFGQRLYRIFFKTYTEKVWGMPCSEISADWAAQRIKGLSLMSAVWHALVPNFRKKNKKDQIKTLIDSFRYPRKGPGMMWEACADKVKAMGSEIMMDRRVVGLNFSSDDNMWVIHTQDRAGHRYESKAKNVISSAPVKELLQALTPQPTSLPYAQNLKYRDFMTVALMVNGEQLFTDNWIYIHDPQVKVGRIQNFRSWSPEMLPTETSNCYGLEYFCNEGDELWSMKDSALIEMAKKEMALLGLIDNTKVIDACVIRQPKAYPVYDQDYSAHMEIIKREIQEFYPGLHMVGRNGMHKYNNQDHAIMTAMLTSENIHCGFNKYDVWQVNQDAEYHEAGVAASQTVSEPTPTERPQESSNPANLSREAKDLVQSDLR